MVKYADGPSAQVEVEIDATPEAVWSLVSDVNLPSSFSEEFQRAEWIDEGPTLGATFRGYNRHPVVGEWDVVCTVTALESGSVFEWSVGEGDQRAARWRFDLDPAAGQPSHCTLRFSAEMGPGPSGLTPAIERMPDREEEIVSRRLSEWTENMQRTVEGIKDLAEGSGPAADAERTQP